MKTLTEAEFDQQWLESLKLNKVVYDTQGFDEVRTSISRWADDSCKTCSFASGVEVKLDYETIYCNHSVENEHDDLQMLVSKFYLSGNHGVISPDIENVEAEYSECSGYNYLFYLPDIKESEQFFTGTPLHKLTINIDLDFLRTFVRGLEDIPKQLQLLIERNRAPRFHRPVGKVTPKMRTVIKQMWHHPYQGAIARMYLQGKVLEVLTLQLAQLAQAESSIPKSTLKSKNIDPIYEARSILTTQLENPPSILELAEQVGVSDRTLRSGFRKLFGTTVLGYLTQQRLQQAETILRTGELSVAEVANLVGYAHLSHFAAAFKRQFGITPRECLAGKLVQKQAEGVEKAEGLGGI